ASGQPQELGTAAQQAIDSIKRPDDPKYATSALVERLAIIEKQNQDLEKRLKGLAEKPEKRPAASASPLRRTR
ncbi:MAG: hypothetical protein L0Y58_19365, partial [Verrucomicrobia subdivision 3 bacterium]|nr:hypothetical protein [Limisphaerales bacterium]